MMVKKTKPNKKGLERELILVIKNNLKEERHSKIKIMEAKKNITRDM